MRLRTGLSRFLSLLGQCFLLYLVKVWAPVMRTLAFKGLIFEVFTAVTMKNVDFWDIQTKFVPHRKHITSPLQRPAH
jgi:hypothetical protein